MRSFDRPMNARRLGDLRRAAQVLFVVIAAGVVTMSSAIAQANIAVNYRSLTAGDGFSCVLASGGGTQCWGSNGHQDGRLGNAPLDNSVLANALAPVGVLGGLHFFQISSGMRHSCGIVEGGAAYCWGSNSTGQLGVDANIGWAHQPVPVSGGIPFIFISAGSGHTCGIDSDHRIHCWGLNAEGQLGNGTIVNGRTPVMIEDNRSYRSVSAGIGSTTCGVTEEGLGFCWGSDAHGQIGDGEPITYSTTDIRLEPMAVAGGHLFQSVHVGANHTCGILTSGAAMCWGGSPLLGIERTDAKSYGYPVMVAGELLFKQLDVGNRHTCGITTEAVLACWGVNMSGESGIASDLGQVAYIPRASAAGQFAEVRVAQGTHPHTCAITANLLSVRCFGLGDYGQLGNGELALNGTVNSVVVLMKQPPDFSAAPSAPPMASSPATADTPAIASIPVETGGRAKPVIRPRPATSSEASTEPQPAAGVATAGAPEAPASSVIPDANEPNNERSEAAFIGSVSEGQDVLVAATFHNDSDEDWYRVHVVESSNSSTDIAVTIVLTADDFEMHDVQFSLYDGSTGPTQSAELAHGWWNGATFTLAYDISDTWGDDSRDVYVKVKRLNTITASGRYNLHLSVHE